MKIIGTGSAHPALEVTNKMLEEFLDTTDEWITTRTGIRSRRLLSEETLEDLARDASLRALENAGLKAEDMDFMICSNVVNDFITPGLGCVVQGMIGAKCPTIDINCACAGFVYGLDIANSYFMSHPEYKYILLVAAEAPGRMVGWNDRANCILFGDGSGAVVLSREGDNFKASTMSTTSKYVSLYEKHRLQPTPFIKREEMDGPLIMDGKDIFKLAVSASIADIDKVQKQAGITSSDVSLYVLHQANTRIIDAIRKFTEQPVEKFPMNIQNYGNTSSATIPILLDDLNRAGKLKDGDMLVMSAFGAGFTTAACVMVW